MESGPPGTGDSNDRGGDAASGFMFEGRLGFVDPPSRLRLERAGAPAWLGLWIALLEVAPDAAVRKEGLRASRLGLGATDAEGDKESSSRRDACSRFANEGGRPAGTERLTVGAKNACAALSFAARVRERRVAARSKRFWKRGWVKEA